MSDEIDTRLFISWIKYHGRSAELAAALGADCRFIEAEGSLIRRYARQWRATRRLLRQVKPKVVIVMQPPVFALLAARFYAPKQARIIGDLHSGAFLDPKWKWASWLTLRLLSGRHAAIVTNEALAARAADVGVRTVVAHDLISTPARTPAPRSAPSSVITAIDGRSFVLVPLAYANDEPLDALLNAARTLPSVTWVLTGRAPSAVRDHAPANVVFSGYVSDDEYAWLVAHSAAMLALTNRDFTMQRAGYEAMAAGKALVTFHADVLRRFFDDAAVYTDATSEGISSAVAEAVTRCEDLAARMLARRESQLQAQEAAISEIRALIV